MEAGRTMEPIRTERLVLREPEEADLPSLVAILREPDVARWWPGFDETEARRAFLGRDDVTVLAIEHQGRPIGAIQFYEQVDPSYRHAAHRQASAIATTPPIDELVRALPGQRR